MYKKNLLLVLVLILALSFSGCLSSLFGGKPTVLEVTPNEVEISLNAEDKTVELTAVVKNDKGEVMKVKETDIKWVIADVEEVEETTENGDGEEEIGPVATLSKQTGSKVTVEGKRVGEAGITVSFKKLTATVDVVVTEIADPKAGLIETITEAEGLKDATQIGINNGQAPVHAHAAFQTAIDDAIAIKDKEDATQEEIDGAATNLETAISMFNLEIVTKADPLKVHTLTVDGNLSHFTTDSKRGTVEINNDLQYIKTGSESIKLAATGAPYPLRVRVSHPNWINDWTQYDHLAAWFYVEDVESLHKDTTIQINHPMGSTRCTIKRSEFVDGWNEIVLSLRDEIGFSDEELVNMTDFFEFNIRFSSDPVPIYFDEIRLLQLEEPIVEPEPLLFENFEGLTDVNEFWTAAYKSLPGDETQPLYFATSGETKMDLVDGKLKIGDARFAIGVPEGRAPTTGSDTEAGGTLDLSKPYRITIKFVEYGDTVTKKFSVFIDNNTSSDANSLHGKASRPYNVALESLPDNKTIVIEPTIGTENSFIQIRQESSSWIILDSIRIEYI